MPPKLSVKSAKIKHPAAAPATQSKAASGSTPITAPNTDANPHTVVQRLPLAPDNSGHASASSLGLPGPDATDAQRSLGQPYKDGRIRNPVPSKLKGKTTASSGRFAVMHMDIRGKEMPADRDLAAKRTSEGTAMAAQKAFESGYQPHRRSWVRVTDEPTDASVPFTGTTPYNHALYGLKPATNPPKEKQPTVTTARALFPSEVKEEQARLLTLLRTIQPLKVVDQLCKAVAYFGGIPDAPPPKLGKFPESAEANGSGAVFVGWIAEIFPDVDAEGRRKSRSYVAPNPTIITEKRGRGRPKGSKASKARSDKGVKKGSKKNPLPGTLCTSGAAQDNSWIDVEGSVMDGDEDHDDEDDDDDDDDDDDGNDDEDIDDQIGNNALFGAPGQPKVGPNPAPVSALFSIEKRGGGRGGRPKGISRTQPYKSTPTTANHMSTAYGANPVAMPQPQAAIPQATVPQAARPHAAAEQPPTRNEYSLSALKAFNNSSDSDPHPQSSSFQPVNDAAPTASAPLSTAAPQAAVKGNNKAPSRKRKRNVKDAEAIVQSGSASIATPPNPKSGMVQSHISDSVLTAVSTALPIPAVPPPKRQRKSRAKPKKYSVDTPFAEAGGVSQPGQTLATPSSVPAPATTMQPADTQIYTTPTIEELEAQLENDTQSPSLAYTELGATQSASQAQSQAAPSQALPPQPQARQSQAQSVSRPQQASLTTEAQRVAARPRQQYQQQSTARTASPNTGHGNTASPHLSVQSASPSIAAANAVSPSLQQQRISHSNSQTPSSVASQIQNQPSQHVQTYYPQQSTPNASPFGQQSSSHYTSPQPIKQQFAVPQSQAQQTYSNAPQTAQQQSTFTGQQSQYPQPKQQSYPPQPQQSYSSPQHQYTSQRSQQHQYTTTSAETTPQLSAPSPQYGTSTTSSYNSSEGNFRTNSATGMNFSSSTYHSNQSSHAARSGNLYPAATSSSYGNPTQPASSYANAGNARRNLPSTAANQAAVQSVQSLPQNLGGFSAFGGLDFEHNIMSGLDATAGSHSNLGLNAATQYGMGAGNVSRSSAASTNFGFDAGLRNDGNSYFGPLRR